MYAVIGRMTRRKHRTDNEQQSSGRCLKKDRYILTKAREEKIASLPAEPMTEADFELRRNLGRLNPEQDFSFWIKSAGHQF